MALIVGTGARSASQGPETRIEWQNIGQLCAYLQLAEPTRKMVKTKQGKWEERLYETPLKKAKVRLYRTTDGEVACCKQEMFVAATISGINGEFEFKGHSQGRYWLVVEWKDGKAQVPVIADKYEPRLCKAKSTHRMVIVDAKPYPRVEIHIS